MTILQCIYTQGIYVEADELKNCQIVKVSFVNAEGKDDEVQFTIHGMGRKSGTKELYALYGAFCRENELPPNTVKAIIVIKSADSLEKLTEQ